MASQAQQEPLAVAGVPLFAVLGGASALGYAGATLLVRSDRTPSDFLLFFTIFFFLACVWGLALWLAHRVLPSRGVVLAGAVLFRLLVLGAGLSMETGQFAREILYDGAGTGLAGKLVALAADLVVLWMLSRWADGVALLSYGWNPLVIQALSGAGHLEGVVAAVLLAGAWYLHGPSAKALAALFALAAIWAQVPAGALPPLIPWLPPAGAMGIVVTAGVWRWRDPSFRFALWILGTAVLVAPEFSPARLTWVLPFAAIERSWLWLAFSGSAFLAYHVRLGFREIPALTLLEVAMPVLVWLWLRRRYN